ncbi:Mu transposase C-terminal domain-containing protein [Solimonas marina]|uniref:Transposase n=1 Tax=Solimonas marina TaxID=2714601 RepID=A0A970B7X8_9GAMM|nr:Mu transposase C-terminal domain-containing protein [Solimonas marina]NKF24383.1 transposase [Solimonas marina]
MRRTSADPRHAETYQRPLSTRGAKISQQLAAAGQLFEYHGEGVTVLEARGSRALVLIRSIASMVEVEVSALTAVPSPSQNLPHVDPCKLSDGELDRAEALQEALRTAITQNIRGRAELTELGSPLGLKWRQMQRYLYAYLADPTLRALIPASRGRKLGSSVLSQEQLRIISSEIDKAKKTATHVSLSEIERHIKKKCTLEGVKIPSRSSIARRVRLQGVHLKLRRKHGVSVAADKIARYAKTHQVKGVLKEVQIDHTPVDILVVDSNRQYVLGRPWLTLVVDVCSRSVLGFYLSFDAPSIVSVARALAMSTMPKAGLLSALGLSQFSWNAYGVAELYHTDRAKEFRCEAFKAACRFHGINTVLRPIGKKHWGGHVERLIGTIMGGLHLLPGTTFSNAKLRKKYPSEKHAVITAEDLLRVIVCEINQYMHTRHSAIGITPQQAFFDGCKDIDGNVVLPPDIGNPIGFMMDFMPSAAATNTAEGLHWRGHRYFSNFLREVPIGKKITFKVDPQNSGAIYIDYRGEFIRIERQTPATYEDISFECQLRYARNSRSREKDMLNQIDLSLQARDEIVDLAKLEKKKAKRAFRAPLDNLMRETLVAAPPARVLDAIHEEFVRPAPDYLVE